MEVIKRKNGIVYREKIYLEGRTVTKTFKRKTDAKLWKNQMLNMKANLELNLKHFEKITFEEFAHKWLEEKVLTYSAISTYNNYKRYLRKHAIPHIGKLYLQDIRRPHIDKLVATLKRNGNNAKGINLVIGCLRNVINEAVEQEFLKQSPLKGLKNLKEDLIAETFMSEMEINRFLQTNVSDALYPFYLTALNTGMRRGELAGLKWDRVNFPRSQIEVSRIRDRHGLRATTKGGRRRIVPMNQQVQAELLQCFHKRVSDYVFLASDNEPVRVQHIYRSFARAQARTGLEQRYRFHDLRHTFASHFMMNGGNLYDLQKILGHSKIEMTMRYAHLAPDHLVDVINIVNFSGTENNVESLSEARRKTG